MNVVGIIAEYNPLHNGHVYHLQQAKERSSAEYCIVCMSGNFVQRGEAACADKYTRAEWALTCGADMVLELPTVFALSPAQQFARAGNCILNSTGVVTHVSFGVENDDLAGLTRVADIEIAEPVQVKDRVAFHLKSGASYPKAYYEAIGDVYGTETAELIRTPNNILAIEYLKAIRQDRLSLTPLPVLRMGAAYEETGLDKQFSSAMGIRRALTEGNDAFLSSVPECVAEYYSKNPGLPSQTVLNAIAYSSLRTATKEQIAALPEVTEGLENKFYDSVRHSSNLNEALEEVKSKRYTLAKLKRTALHSLLGIGMECYECTPYIKVLGFRQDARPLLSEIAANATAPLLIRNRDMHDVPENVLKSLTIDELSTDLYGCLVNHPIRKDHSGAVSI